VFVPQGCRIPSSVLYSAVGGRVYFQRSHMSDDVARLLGDLEAKARSLRSYVCAYRSDYQSGTIPFHVEGRAFFLRPDKFRSVAQVNGKEIVSTRNGSKVRRYATQGHEVWEYDLKEIPLPTPLNAGVDDLLSPFAFVDRRSLRYEGAEVVGDRVRHVFLGTLRGMESEGLLDTRKGFSLRYRPKVPRFDLRLCVDAETGILLEMTGSGPSVAGFTKSFTLEQVNGSVDESLFQMTGSGVGYRIVRISDLMIHAMDANYADQPPSKN